MATKLNLYNGALLELKARKLSSLTEQGESRRALDEAWDDGFVDEILRMGQWNFAMRSVEIGSDSTLSPQFGYVYGFSKPADWVRTTHVAIDEDFHVPNIDYLDEGIYWFANTDPLFIRYISNGASYGNNLAIWPADFTRFAKLYLAYLVCGRITQSDSDWATIEKKMEKARTRAQSTDAQQNPTETLPRGSWAAARMGAIGRRYNTDGNPRG